MAEFEGKVKGRKWKRLRKTDEKWMRIALAEAGLAREAGEVPVGALIVRDGVLLASARNSPISLHDPSAHAEILAIRAAAALSGITAFRGRRST